eukprot:CAMPEP_0115032498 /NCGR_PEP_ID=MMETSP0216-20121206/39198_1 /TAXON_ID=223996 /ORGANISM="Protocruzia adherens, Strain Boccale" /LENGTH=336 /DNA_ID=CAMNT_0002410417 /DNA_START=30 /DNA_END=1040 /DNA_ORIENTATION=+
MKLAQKNKENCITPSSFRINLQRLANGEQGATTSHGKNRASAVKARLPLSKLNTTFDDGKKDSSFYAQEEAGNNLHNASFDVNQSKLEERVHDRFKLLRLDPSRYHAGSTILGTFTPGSRNERHQLQNRTFTQESRSHFESDTMVSNLLEGIGSTVEDPEEAELMNTLKQSRQSALFGNVSSIMNVSPDKLKESMGLSNSAKFKLSDMASRGSQNPKPGHRRQSSKNQEVSQAEMDEVYEEVLGMSAFEAKSSLFNKHPRRDLSINKSTADIDRDAEVIDEHFSDFKHRIEIKRKQWMKISNYIKGQLEFDFDRETRCRPSVGNPFRRRKSQLEAT